MLVIHPIPSYNKKKKGKIMKMLFPNSISAAHRAEASHVVDNLTLLDYYVKLCKGSTWKTWDNTTKYFSVLYI